MQTLISWVSDRLCRAAIWPWLSRSCLALSWSSASLVSAWESEISFSCSMKRSVASCFSSSTFISVENLVSTQVDVCCSVTYGDHIKHNLGNPLLVVPSLRFFLWYLCKYSHVISDFYTQAIHQTSWLRIPIYLGCGNVLCQLNNTPLCLLNEFSHLHSLPCQQQLWRQMHQTDSGLYITSNIFASGQNWDVSSLQTGWIKNQAWTEQDWGQFTFSNSGNRFFSYSITFGMKHLYYPTYWLVNDY